MAYTLFIPNSRVVITVVTYTKLCFTKIMQMMYMNMEGLTLETNHNYLNNYVKLNSAVLDEEKLIGVKRTFSINVNGAEVEATMTSLIHPNGKVSFYYDKIPKKLWKVKLISKLTGIIKCEDGLQKFFAIHVPEKWIKSGTLVEFQAIGEFCLQYDTSETCQNAKTPTTTCFCCEKIEEKKEEIEYEYQDSGRK
uniref:Uncharacterized protein n=1 Tax=Schistosoma mansoni TaxID=6183 RepID=A0AA82N7Y8_SCHMA